MNGELLVNMVNKAVTKIVGRLQGNNYENVQDLNFKLNSLISISDLAIFDNAESKVVSTLTAAAMSPENLCRMDPAYHPWI